MFADRVFKPSRMVTLLGCCDLNNSGRSQDRNLGAESGSFVPMEEPFDNDWVTGIHWLGIG